MHIIKILARAGALEILNTLSEGEKRDRDIKRVVANPSVRVTRINELEDNGLIKRMPMKVGRVFITHYSLTEKGTEILKKLREL